MYMSPETIAIVVSTVGGVLTLFAGLGAMLAWMHKALKADITTASATIRNEMLVRFDKVDERFDRVDERFADVDARFDRIDERFEKVGAEFKEARSELESVKISLARIEGPLPRFLPTTRR